MNSIKLLRLPAVCERTGTRKSTAYNSMASGLLPKAVRAGAHAVGWPEHEIDAVLRARIAGRTDDEIRALVQRLHAERTAVAA